MPSNRIVSQQFDRGITLDGNRIENNLQRLAQVLNEVTPEYIRRRWYPTHWSSGYLPSLLAYPIAIPQLPWAVEYNGGDPDPVAQTPTTYQNPYRHKACAVATINPATKTPALRADGTLYTWEQSLYLSKPTMLDRVTLFWLIDSAYPNPFTYQVGAPPPFANGDPSQDFSVTVLVDSVSETEDRTQTSVEVVAGQFSAARARICKVQPDPALDTMQPPFPTGPAWGLAVDIPATVLLPENCRVRFCITVPQYGSTTAANWGDTPWTLQVTSLHVGLYEVK